MRIIRKLRRRKGGRMLLSLVCEGIHLFGQMGREEDRGLGICEGVEGMLC